MTGGVCVSLVTPNNASDYRTNGLQDYRVNGQTDEG